MLCIGRFGEGKEGENPGDEGGSGEDGIEVLKLLPYPPNNQPSNTLIIITETSKSTIFPWKTPWEMNYFITSTFPGMKWSRGIIQAQNKMQQFNYLLIGNNLRQGIIYDLGINWGNIAVIPRGDHHVQVSFQRCYCTHFKRTRSMSLRTSKKHVIEDQKICKWTPRGQLLGGHLGMG